MTAKREKIVMVLIGCGAVDVDGFNREAGDPAVFSDYVVGKRSRTRQIERAEQPKKVAPKKSPKPRKAKAKR
jgi:hypothetical protein